MILSKTRHFKQLRVAVFVLIYHNFVINTADQHYMKENCKYLYRDLYNPI